MALKIALYEPEPRICGPGTWIMALRSGFRQLGHSADIVTFTRSGKAREKWGRIVQEAGCSQSCHTDVDVCYAESQAGPTLDAYDLVIVPDPKCAPQDNKAYEEFDTPFWIEALGRTKTPFTFALHGNYYWQEHEVPEGCAAKYGTPYMGDLLDLPNAPRAIVRHARQFDQHCKRLQNISGPVLPLPYELKCPEDQAFALRAGRSFATIGRMIPQKFRHLVLDGMACGDWHDLCYTMAGACATTHGPSESFMLYEQLQEHGWRMRRDKSKGVRSNVVWYANNGGSLFVEYWGTYEQPIDVLGQSCAHLGITDCKFSGGLVEFATLESIDCGCVPITTRAFMPDDIGATDGLEMVVLERDFDNKGSLGRTGMLKHPERAMIHLEIGAAITEGIDMRTREIIAHNRECLRSAHDPRIVAKAFIEVGL